MIGTPAMAREPRRPGRLTATALMVAVAMAGPAGAQEPLVLTNVTVIDGRGGPPVPRQRVVIEGGRIRSVGDSRTGSTPAGARVIDLAGKFLVPGLIDTHLHGPPDTAKVTARLAWLLRNGITSARDMAGHSGVFRAAARIAEPAATPMAQLYYVAFWAGPSFYQVDRRPIGSTDGKPPGTVPWFQAVDGSSDLDRLAGEARALGAHSLKLYSDLSLERFRGAVAAASRAGIRAASHVAVFPIAPRDVIASGVNTVSHAALLVWAAVDSVPARFHTAPNTNFGPIGPYRTVAPDDPRIAALLDEMARRGIVLDATVSVIARAISPEASAWTLEATRLAHRRGVPISTGTDRPEDPAPDRKPALFDEIEALVSGAGLTPLEAITAATKNGARAIGIESERGTIEPGKIADLLVVTADPASDVANLRRASLVIKGGVPHQVRE